MTVTKLATKANDAAANGMLALYADNGGAPSALVASTPSTPIYIGLNEIPVLTQVVVNPGNYWIMAVYSQDTFPCKDTSPTVTEAYVNWPFGTPLPSPFPSPCKFGGGGNGCSLIMEGPAHYYVVGVQ
jgi:hypothetical protein